MKLAPKQKTRKAPVKVGPAKKARRKIENKPVSIGVIHRILLQNVSVLCPEARLVVAILTQAISESASVSRALRDDARKFIDSRHFDRWCHLVGLEPSFVKDISRRAGYLPIDAPKEEA